MSLKVRVGPVTTTIEETFGFNDPDAFLEARLFDEELHTLRAGLRTDRLQARLNTAGITRPDAEKCIFLSGYLPLLKKRLTGRFSFSLVESAPPDLERHAEPSLRNYQEEAKQLAVKEMRGILDMGTGAGKTRTAAAIIQHVGHRWLYLVHRGSLVTQTLRSFRELGVPAYSLREEDRPPRGHEVLIATYQSLVNRPDVFLQTEGLIVDECHRAAGEEYTAVILRANQAIWRIGLSATPLDREDGFDPLTIGLLGPVLFQKTLRELQQDGTLATGKAVFHPYRSERNIENLRAWQDVRQAALVTDEARNELIVQLIQKAEAPAFVLVVETAHGLTLKQALNEAGVPTDFVEGSDPVALRDRRIALLNHGHLKCLVATSVFDEGVDVPELRTVVVAGGGKSTIQAVQRLGRAVRKPAGKLTFVLHDFADDGHAWLRRHATERAHVYQAAGLLIEGHEFLTNFELITHEDWEEEDELLAELRDRDGVALSTWDPWKLGEPCFNTKRLQKGRHRQMTGRAGRQFAWMLAVPTAFFVFLFVVGLLSK